MTATVLGYSLILVDALELTADPIRPLSSRVSGQAIRLTPRPQLLQPRQGTLDQTLNLGRKFILGRGSSGHKFKELPRPAGSEHGEVLICRDGFEGFENLPTGKTLKSRKRRKIREVITLGQLDIRSGTAVSRSWPEDETTLSHLPDRARPEELAFRKRIHESKAERARLERAIVPAETANSRNSHSHPSSRPGVSPILPGNAEGVESYAPLTNTRESSASDNRLPASRKQSFATQVTHRNELVEANLQEDRHEYEADSEDGDADDELGESEDQENEGGPSTCQSEGEASTSDSEEIGQSQVEMSEEVGSEQEEEEALGESAESEGETPRSPSAIPLALARGKSVDLGHSFPRPTLRDFDIGQVIEASLPRQDDPTTQEEVLDGEVAETQHQSPKEARKTLGENRDDSSPWAKMDRIDAQIERQNRKRAQSYRVTGGEWFRSEMSRFPTGG